MLRFFKSLVDCVLASEQDSEHSVRYDFTAWCFRLRVAQHNGRFRIVRVPAIPLSDTRNGRQIVKAILASKLELVTPRCLYTAPTSCRFVMLRFESHRLLHSGHGSLFCSLHGYVVGLSFLFSYTVRPGLMDRTSDDDGRYARFSTLIFD